MAAVRWNFKNPGKLRLFLSAARQWLAAAGSLIQRFSGTRKEFAESYWLTRFLTLRLLAGIYVVAFWSLSNQLEALIGSHGILPADLLFRRMEAGLGSSWSGFADFPTVFWWHHGDGFMLACCYVGLALSLLVLAGLTNAIVMAFLWALYFSFVNVGQLFYGFGWESMVLESGFLAIFLCPPTTFGPFPRGRPPFGVLMWLYRWFLFRVMFGAGMIKIRGDDCWRDLTCLHYHFETQPIPNPLSWYLHQLPDWTLKSGVLFNHFAELIVPFLLFAPRRVRHLGGVLTILFQLFLIVSGNLSWLNWLTIAIAIPCFDDRALRFLFPKRWREQVKDLAASPIERRRNRLRLGVAFCLFALVVILSKDPVVNMLSPNQLMNTSFNELRLVNTYGAFGSVGQVRHEVIIQGTYDAGITAATEWQEYEFKMKPGGVNRRPGIISPYHYRLDWQIWFAAMSSYQRHPWLVHFIYKLLLDEPKALDLIAHSPFDRGPPRFIKAELYEYRFTSWGDDTDAWWTRKWVRSYLPPVSVNNPSLLQFLRNHGWLE